MADRRLTERLLHASATGPDDIAPPNPSLHSLRRMDHDRFERFVAELWEEMGYKTVERPSSGDNGIDVIARKRGPMGKTTAIQAKRYKESNTVGSPEIQQYFAMKYQVGADEGLLVTTGRFTSQAHDRAADLGVKLIDGHDLIRLIRNHTSVAFYRRYRAELGIDDDELAAWVAHRESRTVVERVRRRLADAVGTTEVVAGRALQDVGETLRSTQRVLRRAELRLRGYDPVLATEDGEGPRESDDDDLWGQNLIREGNSLAERGFGRRELPLVSWTLGTRSIVPLAGISPRLRMAKNGFDHWLVLAMVGFVLTVASVGMVYTEVGARFGPTLVGLLSFAGGLASVAGVVGATLAGPMSFGNLVRLCYVLPLLAPVANWAGRGVGSIPPLPTVGLPAVAGLCAFGLHTLVLRSLHTEAQWRLDDLTESYVPVHEPSTVFGLSGSIAVVGGVLLSGIGVPFGDVGVVRPLVELAVACGFVCVTVDATGRLFRGGLIAFVAGTVLTGYLVWVAHTLGALPPSIAFGSDLFLVVSAVTIGGLALLVRRSRTRALRRSWALVGGGAALLAGTAYFAVRLTGLSQLQTAIPTETVAYAAVGASVVFYGALVVIEQLVVQQTLFSSTAG